MPQSFREVCTVTHTLGGAIGRSRHNGFLIERRSLTQDPFLSILIPACCYECHRTDRNGSRARAHPHPGALMHSEAIQGGNANGRGAAESGTDKTAANTSPALNPEALWSISFESHTGIGANGIVLFEAERIFGGDSAMI
jgi:hypothetical protein